MQPTLVCTGVGCIGIFILIKTPRCCNPAGPSKAKTIPAMSKSCSLFQAVAEVILDLVVMKSTGCLLRFRYGFNADFVTQFYSPMFDKPWFRNSVFGNTVTAPTFVAAAIGGMAAQVGEGEFANGAGTGALLRVD